MSLRGEGSSSPAIAIADHPRQIPPCPRDPPPRAALVPLGPASPWDSEFGCPILPVVGIAAQVHHCHDRDEIRLDSEHDSEGEDSGKTTPDIVFHHGVEFGIRFNEIQSILDCNKKALPKAWLLRLVPLRSTDHLRPGFWMKANETHLRAA